MAPITPTGGNFELVPEGLYPGVCCEFVDLGIVESKWGKKPKGRWIFQVETNGKRMEISRSFTLSTGGKTKPSNLRKYMEKWRGQPYTWEELENGDLDPEKVVGQPCTVFVEHSERDDGDVIHYIDKIMPPGKVRLEPVDYTPVAERSGNEDRDEGQTEDHEEPAGSTTGKVPF